MMNPQRKTASSATSIPEIKTEFLFTLALEVEVANLCDTPYGSRRVGRFGLGNFEGPMLKGTVLPGGACWMLMRRDDVLEIDARITLETGDKQQIYMTWKAFRHGPKEVIDRLNRGDAIDPEMYYSAPRHTSRPAQKNTAG
jgi:hypothetical protein